MSNEVEAREKGISPVVLEADNISIGYHEGISILDDISLQIAKGEMVGLIGPNGAGKSTLLKTLRGIIKAHKGDIFLNGRLIDDYSTREFACEVAYLQQHVEISFGYSAREIVTVGRYPRLSWWEKEGEDDLRVVDACMAYTGTTELKDKSMHEISGGQRQRVLLAKVLAQQTPILFLDEPSTGLDIFYQEEIFRFCRELCSMGKTVLMVVHELGLAAKFCSRLILLGEKKIIADGSPEDVLTDENLTLAYHVPVTVTKHKSTGFYEISTAHVANQMSKDDVLQVILA